MIQFVKMCDLTFITTETMYTAPHGYRKRAERQGLPGDRVFLSDLHPSELVLDDEAEDLEYSQLAQQKEDKQMDQQVIPIRIQLGRDIDRATRNLRQAKQRVLRMSAQLESSKFSKSTTNPNKAWEIEFFKKKKMEAISKVTFENIALENSTKALLKWENIHLHEPYFGDYPQWHPLFVSAKAKRPLPRVQPRDEAEQRSIELFDMQMDLERAENRRIDMQRRHVRETPSNVKQTAPKHFNGTHVTTEYYCRECGQSYCGKWELGRHESTKKHARLLTNHDHTATATQHDRRHAAAIADD
jgi:hypothetical protein